MKKEPLKVYLAKDFSLAGGNYVRKHLSALTALGLIEEVDASYRVGSNGKGSTVKAWRLKR